KLLATGAADNTIRLWKADTGEELRKMETGWWVNSVALSPDAKTLSSSAWAKATIRLWGAETGKELKKLEGPKRTVAGVACSPGGKLLASVPRASRRAKDQDGAARLWDVASGKEVARLEGHDSEATCLAFSPDGKRLATADGRGRVRVWDVA